ncbi:hypothetical protein RHMOL_Rhmol01G0082400 [Rhododendron molle]|uniref:Uncharacterized protein n=1 Tax=Rhododendron molle TaxID=49168 RepID=A0ACC0Q152_RHOML|nr:hypothetical protein RHMOL_Rhmol01G0082400 [Rhododendron molle]
MLLLEEGIAIGRSFAILKNEQVDGNKEMIAFGFMNLVGSFTSCYLTTGPFSKTAVNFNAGCKTAMANVAMAACMLLTLLFLAPMFSYTPLAALSAIILSAMLGLIEYEKAYRLFKTDKCDFLICMAAFLGVAFISMDVGLMLSVGLAILRALLYVARPATCKLGRVTCIDITGVETLIEILKALEAKGIKMALVNPRLEVMEKLIVTKFIDTIGKENVFLSIEDAIEASRFNLKSSK